ncbi:hypothetical protein D3C72_2061230 [compost metagenome]
MQCGIADAGAQAQEALFAEHRLLQRLVVEGAGVAQVAFLAEPQQGAQAALVAHVGQAVLVGLVVADQVVDIEGGLARKHPVEGEQGAAGVVVEIVDLQIHGENSHQPPRRVAG